MTIWACTPNSLEAIYVWHRWPGPVIPLLAGPLPALPSRRPHFLFLEPEASSRGTKERHPQDSPSSTSTWVSMPKRGYGDPPGAPAMGGVRPPPPRQGKVVHCELVALSSALQVSAPRTDAAAGARPAARPRAPPPPRAPSPPARRRPRTLSGTANGAHGSPRQQAGARPSLLPPAAVTLALLSLPSECRCPPRTRAARGPLPGRPPPQALEGPPSPAAGLS